VHLCVKDMIKKKRIIPVVENVDMQIIIISYAKIGNEGGPMCS